MNEAHIPEPYLCIRPACGDKCSGCNNAISPEKMREYAIAYAALIAKQPPEQEQDDSDDLGGICPECNGDGGDKWNDYILPCPLCQGSRHV